MFVKILVTLWAVGAAYIAHEVMETAKADAEEARNV